MYSLKKSFFCDSNGRSRSSFSRCGRIRCCQCRRRFYWSFSCISGWCWLSIWNCSWWQPCSSFGRSPGCCCCCCCCCYFCCCCYCCCCCCCCWFRCRKWGSSSNRSVFWRLRRTFLFLMAVRSNGKAHKDRNQDLENKTKNKLNLNLGH